MPVDEGVAAVTVAQPLDRIQFAAREIVRFRSDIDDGERTAPASDGWAWDEVVAKANFLFDRLIDLDLDIQELVLNDRMEYDPALGEKVRRLLRDWLDVSLRVIPHVEGHVVDGADLLRSRVTEARSMLTPGGEFFGGDELARLRDRAIDEHRAGRTEPFDADEPAD